MRGGAKASWDVSKDFKQLTFHLRKGVTFHTGRPFTSDDVKYNLLRVRQPNVGTQFTNMSKWFSGIDTPCLISSSCSTW